MENEERNQVLFDYLSGSLSLEGMKGVERWIEESEEHRMYFAAFRKDFLQMRWGMRMGMVKGTWKELVRRRRLRMVRRVSAWAAVVVCIVSVGLAWLVPTEHEDQAGMEVADIVPGKVQAQLTLSNGERVTLGGSSRQLKEVNGVAIDVDLSGVMSYVGQTGKNDGAEVVYNTVSTPRGGEYAIVLADSTKVWLNAGTELRFPVYFSGNRREVYLKGEAYFEVASDAAKPFVVRVNDMRVRVLGTSFNVNAYNPACAETALVAGRVVVDVEGSDREWTMQPSDLLRFDSESGEVTVTQTDLYPYIAWKDGEFLFRNRSIEEIMEILARWYDIEVEYRDESIKQFHFTGDIRRRADVRVILNALTANVPVTYILQQRKVILYHQ